MFQLKVLADASEVIPYNNPEVPLYVNQGRLSAFTNREMICHWHEDVEYVRPVSGRMFYHINGETVLLEEGDAILINSKQLHYGTSERGAECVYDCVVFRPEILCGNFAMQRNYVNSITENPQLVSWRLPRGSGIAACLERVMELYRERPAGYELRALARLNAMWALLYEAQSAAVPAKMDLDVPVQKNMVEFIYHHYSSKISLEEIARAGGVCRSKCCQLFKKYLNKTPGEFLHAYRLEAAAGLLRTTAGSVTEISYACGFNSPSYFSESFGKWKGCTPREYRTARREA